jgi:hypothetical protein
MGTLAPLGRPIAEAIHADPKTVKEALQVHAGPYGH